MTMPDPLAEEALAFWSAQSKRLHWIVQPTISVLAPGLEPRVAGGVLNVCFNAVDRHVALGRAEQTAIGTDGEDDLTFADLTEQTAQFAGVLRTLGLVAGDQVLTCLPRSADFAVVLLACARIGVHCLIAGENLEAAALTEVIEINRPIVVVRGTGGFATTVARALELSIHQPERSVVVAPRLAGQPKQRGNTQDLAEWELDFHRLMRSSAIQPTECVPMPAAAPLYTTVALAPDSAKLLRRTVDTGEHTLRLIAGRLPSDQAATEALWPSRSIIAPLLVGQSSRL
ncbi:MAG: propionyl-CoA synthetase [Frankiales bacterium]|jgi:propionyl-CoA synthetase|nr:propionyl-CoA synthetase [Frankiales bacterium]